ncbi:hypothetical protein GGX14DRAFT_377952 [Mycena pura]|uniref:Uncharacterized protein n=1 Tax=Mycena pura TaxID=153505 RepID=A0AAD6UU49_9AGAR|nr:hypothetical protein GGX14DRAFT_377952 [Mycena pura]
MALARKASLSGQSTMSVLSATYTTALDVCTTMYGESAAPADAAAIERSYEASASAYENPVLTATSRAVIADIHALARQLAAIDVPRPVALVCTLLRLQPPRTGILARHIDRPLFQALRVWTEIGDICESESFDGNRKTIVEHTLNILVLPGIHRDGHYRAQPAAAESLERIASSLSPSLAPAPHPHAPTLSVPGTSLTLPSPLHFRLHVITRLAFNEQGRITHHRDFWDVRDVLGLVPGASLAQWIGTRLAARGMSYAAAFLPGRAAAAAGAQGTSVRAQDAMEKGLSPAASEKQKACDMQ